MKSAVPILAIAAAGAMLAAAVQAAGPVRVGNVYYEDLFTNNTCGGAGVEDCRFYSSTPTPTDAYVRIKHVACQYSVTTGGTLYRAKLQVWNGVPGATGASVLKEFAVGVPTQPVPVSTSNLYTIDTETHFLVGAGRYIALQAQGNGGTIASSLTCGITGDLVPPQ
ncbi:MAG: hypothetical protein JOZ16_18735 [Methylobacteriaceae bacterium]|nr:hypothetical protein [Methylobacteriaceae bacterium]